MYQACVSLYPCFRESRKQGSDNVYLQLNKKGESRGYKNCEHTDGLVVVAGVVIGGAPVTVEKEKRGRPPKHPDDTSTGTYKKRDNRVCG
jgi:hypothetical protein